MSPRVSDAKNKILDAAKELFWVHNYGTVSVDDICKKADVKKGSFYHFFNSKAELCASCLESHWENHVPAVDSVFSASKDPIKRVKDFAKLVYDFQAELKAKHGCVLGCPVSQTGSEMSSEEEVLREVSVEIFDKYVAYFSTAIRDANAKDLIKVKNIEAKASQMVAFFKGVLYHAKITNDVEVIKKELEAGLLALISYQKT